MKNFFRSLAVATLALAATPSFAQATPKPKLPHDKAVEIGTYLARQKAFAAECPYSESVKATLDRLESMALPVIGLPTEELDAFKLDAQASARQMLKEPKVKEMTCPILEAALRRQAEQVLSQKATVSATPKKLDDATAQRSPVER